MKKQMKVPASLIKKEYVSTPQDATPITIAEPIKQTTSSFAQLVEQVNTENRMVSSTDELSSLKALLREKELFIERLQIEKQELFSKLAVSEANNLSLSKEAAELKIDKAELRSDKAMLHEVIANLKQSNLVKSDEVEKLKQELADFSFIEHSSIIKQLQEVSLDQHSAEVNPIDSITFGQMVESILVEDSESSVIGENAT